MTFNKRNMTGYSLVEVILALTIAGTITMMGLKAYKSYRLSLAAQEVTANVESIIRAAALYYYANCKQQSGTTTPVATLDPTNTSATTITVPLATLISSGYLDRAPPANPLTTTDYIVQFNRQTPDPIKYYCADPASNPSNCQPIGKSVVWNIQVAVMLNNTTNADQYLKLSGAGCLTSAGSVGANTRVFACSSSAGMSAQCQSLRNTPRIPAYLHQRAQTQANVMGCPESGSASAYGNYLAWERLPSMASPKSQSVLWMSNPVVRQFQQDMAAPLSLTEMIDNPTTKFLCGS